MKFYYSPGSCSLGVHILMEEAGVAHEGVLTSVREGAQFAPEYRAINPNAKVPAIVLDDGTVITEYLAISVWLAATNPQRDWLPADPAKLAHAIEIVSYINSTVHMQGFMRIFRPERFGPAEAREAARAEGKAIFAAGIERLSAWLGGQDYFLGDFTIADPAAFYICFWAKARDVVALPDNLAAFFARMKARPAVRRSMEQEGLPVA